MKRERGPHPDQWPDPWHDRKRLGFIEIALMSVIAISVITLGAWGLADLFSETAHEPEATRFCE